MFQLKDYQQRSLDALQHYFQLANKLNDPDTAYYQTTKETMGRGIPYNPVEGLGDLPYVCIRIPTGGGKTFVAAHSVGIAAQDLLGQDDAVILWLVPTTTILEQTLDTLQDPEHPYRKALEQNATGGVRVMGVSDALEVNRATLDTQTTVIVSTMQAFRVEDTEGRKVYDDSGALMDHFQNLRPEQKEPLATLENGEPKRSLANVLALRRPIVLVDEAHHARTDLSFDTLSRFDPSCIVEFTATPHREEDRRSNVLHSVSAAELKAEDMIKLPIELTTYQPWKELLNLSIEQRDHLEEVANEEEKETGEYIRPVTLIKAEAAYSDDSVTTDVVEECLMEDFNIPAEQIAIATGSSDDLEGVDILDRSCPIRYVITIQKLGEGWDCPFAYVLCSVAAMRSNQAVEQIVGRVLRMPNVTRKQREALNKAYAFAADDDFGQALESMHDVLVENGFERQEAETLVRQSMQQRERKKEDLGPLWNQPDSDDAKEPEVAFEVTEVPDLESLPSSTRKKVSFDAENGRVTYRGSMDDTEKSDLKQAIKDADIGYRIDEAQQRIQQQTGGTVSAPVERGVRLDVPKLVIKQGDAWETFRKTHFTDYDWQLNDFDATLPDYEPKRPTGERGTVDTDEEGNLKIEFLDRLQRQLALLGDDDRWDVPSLVRWLDRTIPHQDIRPSDSINWLERLVQRHLFDERGFSLDHLVRDKYRLKRAVEARIDEHRSNAHANRYDQLLFGGDGDPPTDVKPEICFSFDEDYPYARLYQGDYDFTKHYYPSVGDMNGEEARCAFQLDNHPRIDCWVRNLEQRPQHAFWLQTSTDRFYPDFVCKLRNDRILVVEYKGKDRWSNDDSKEKRNLGRLWAKRSGGHCYFVMPKGVNFDAVETEMEAAFEG
jgi:type III restriction enzyme